LKDIETYSGLEAVLIGIIQEVLEEVGKKVEQAMKDIIDKDVYQAHTPNQYERTHQLRDSVTASKAKSVKGGGEVEIYHDESKITYKPLYQHGSPFSGDISEFIPEIIAFNLSGNLFDSNKWWHHRSNYYQDTLKLLKEKGMLSKWFKEGLKSRGIDIG